MSRREISLERLSSVVIATIFHLNIWEEIKNIVKIVNFNRSEKLLNFIYFRLRSFLLHFLLEDVKNRVPLEWGWAFLYFFISDPTHFWNLPTWWDPCEACFLLADLDFVRLWWVRLEPALDRLEVIFLAIEFLFYIWYTLFGTKGTTRKVTQSSGYLYGLETFDMTRHFQSVHIPKQFPMHIVQGSVHADVRKYIRDWFSCSPGQ